MPEGAEFTGLVELSDVLVKERIHDLTEQICRRMFSYALGRQLEYFDESTVRDLVERVNGDDRRIRSLIHAIVMSDTFCRKQVPSDDPH